MRLFIRLCLAFLCLCSLGMQAQTEKKVITVNLENDAVKRFIDEVVYTPDSESRLANYLPADMDKKRYDIPKPVVIDVPVYRPDTLIKTSIDTLITNRIDTLIQVHADTLYYVEQADYQYIDTLITVKVDSIFTHSETTTISIVRDTLVTIPNDTLLLCYSTNEDYSAGDTIRINNGQQTYNLYNLIPKQTYYFKIEVADSLLSEGEIHTQGRVRMIDAPSIINIRDLGGLVNDKNQQIRYGMIYRGGELNGQHVADSVDIQLLKNLGIEAEIDMRYNGENDGAGISAFGFLSENEIGDDELPTYLFTDNSGCCDLIHLTYLYWRQRYKKEFEYIVKNIRLGRPVYYHCILGADRTGMLSIMLEGLLGISYSDMVKDMELSSFSGIVRQKESREFIFNYFNSLYGGDTLQEKIRYYFIYMLGVSSDDIDYFCEKMLTEKSADDDDPDDNIKTSVENQSAMGISAHQAVYDISGKRIQTAHGNGITIMKDKKEIGHKVSD